VLIVEDDRAARRAICGILKARGFAVSEAPTVADAVSALERKPPTWILLDLMLPDGCGLEVLRRSRAGRARSKVCIITGCDADLLAEARHSDAEHTFTKPLNMDHLMSLLSA
jgi:DNA-binding response OmpR family regulator